MEPGVPGSVENSRVGGGSGSYRTQTHHIAPKRGATINYFRTKIGWRQAGKEFS